MVLLDILLSKVQISFDYLLKSQGGDSGEDKPSPVPSPPFTDLPERIPQTMAAAHELAAPLGAVVEALARASRATVLAGLKGEDETPVNEQTRQVYDRVLGLCGRKCAQTIVTIVGCRAGKLFPAGLQERLRDWGEAAQVGFPPQASSRNYPIPDLMPFETYISMTLR